jgi:hypothetical protein
MNSPGFSVMVLSRPGPSIRSSLELTVTPVSSVQRSDLGHAQARTIGDAESGLVLDAGGGRQKTRHLLGAQHDRNLPWLRDQRQGLDGVGPIERHGEKQAQRRDREVAARWPHAARGQGQLEKPQIRGARRVG